MNPEDFETSEFRRYKADVAYHMARVKQASERTKLLGQQSEEVGAQIFEIIDRLTDAGVTPRVLKWRVTSRIRAARKATARAAHDLDHARRIEAEWARRAMQTENMFSMDTLSRKLADAAEHTTTKADAYLRAAQAELAIWNTLAQ